MPDVRTRLGARLFARVAGPEGPGRRARIHGTPGPRWFPEGAAIRRVHGDASMFTGGVRALLLQSLHPLAMAGVAAHSGFAGDPWGRLQRTSYFLAVTTFGPEDDAEAMVRRIRSIHETVVGTAPDGRAYAASDPHLLRWVHIAEIDSFLTAHQRYGAEPLDAAGRDEYVAQTAVVAERLGAVDPPRSEQELRDQLAAYRPELRPPTRRARRRGSSCSTHPSRCWRGCPTGDRRDGGQLLPGTPAASCGCPSSRWPRRPSSARRPGRHTDDPLGDGSSTRDAA